MCNKIGKVYVASMNLRGEWYPLPEDCKRVNVTSSQQKDSPYRKTFSPMTAIKGGYKGYHCFENYWQSGKRYENMNDDDTEYLINWWKNQKKGHRKYPFSKGKKVIHAIFPHYENSLDYIPSRKLVYVPEYYELIKDTKTLNKLKENLKLGINYVIYDFDGPRLNDGAPDIMEVNINNLNKKINDPKFPFGHGYIVAAALLDISPKDYID